MPTDPTTQAATCPECDADVSIPEDAMQGEIVACDDCAAELEVLQLEPALTLGLAPEIQEDWGE
ncbi:MAG: lysine biosynthesis protein LysW [bacterium]|nr:lysine biosynthesis protein LysW [bacterium]